MNSLLSRYSIQTFGNTFC